MEDDARHLIIRLAVAIMAADGRITAQERQALSRFDSLGLGALSEIAKEEIRRAELGPVDVRTTCEQLTGISRKAATALIALLTEVAVSDRSLSASERSVLDVAAGHMGIEPSEAQRIITSVIESYGAASVANGDEEDDGTLRVSPPVTMEPFDLGRAYRILGLAPGASRATIDDAYLSMIDRYNPSKIADLGSEFAALAVYKLAEITAAFDAVREFTRR